jgi:hypothetical protein
LGWNADRRAKQHTSGDNSEQPLSVHERILPGAEDSLPSGAVPYDPPSPRNNVPKSGEMITSLEEFDSNGDTDV